MRPAGSKRALCQKCSSLEPSLKWTKATAKLQTFSNFSEPFIDEKIFLEMLAPFDRIDTGVERPAYLQGKHFQKKARKKI